MMITGIEYKVEHNVENYQGTRRVTHQSRRLRRTTQSKALIILDIMLNFTQYLFTATLLKENNYRRYFFIVITTGLPLLLYHNIF